MKGSPLFIIATLALVTIASANTFTVDGTKFEPTYGYTFREDRHLVPDGSFEAGCDFYWSCTTDNTCTWITDLVPLGLWNYDGNMTAWLGGFCNDIATEWTSICQTMLLETYCPPGLIWHWMAYINDGGSRVYLTIDGETVWEKILEPSDHMLGYQEDGAIFWGWEFITAEVCFNYERNGAYGDNYFVDYVEFMGLGPTAVEIGSFSTVKSMY